MFKQCYDGKINAYTTSLELKSKTFILNNKNVKQENGIELIFTLKTRIQNQHFSKEMPRFFSDFYPDFSAKKYPDFTPIFHQFVTSVSMEKYICMSQLKN